jgi:hypothetical protein
MEQRINSLEEELKVLKSQIKAVLLDIKEYMATAGSGQSYGPPSAAGGGVPTAAPPMEGHTGPGPITVTNYGGSAPAMGSEHVGPAPTAPAMGGEHVGPAPAAGGGYYTHQACPDSYDGECVHTSGRRQGAAVAERRARGEEDSAAGSRPQFVEKSGARDLAGEDRPGQTDSMAAGVTNENQVLDLLTVSVLAQWLARAIPAVGREQIGKLVEIYDITGGLPPRLKDTMLLLADLCTGDEPEGGSAKAESVPAAVSVQLLIELDSLLRYRNGAFESVVLSMLLDKGQGGKRDSHG